MTLASTERTSLRSRVREHRAELALALRVTVAAVLAFVVSAALHVPLPLWTVLTAVILTQATFGSSLKATIDYMLGTFCGAIYGGAIAVLIPHESELARVGVLALTVAPLALLGGIKPSFATASFTGVLVLMVPEIAHVSPVQSSLYRMIEVAVGALTALIASLIVVRTRAQSLLVDAAAGMLDLMAQALPEFAAALIAGRDAETLSALQDRIGDALGRLETLAGQVRHERIGLLAAKQPDPGPLLRTLLRLRHDLVILGRACRVPLPGALEKRFTPALLDLLASTSGQLRGMAGALVARRAPPPPDGIEASLDAFMQTFVAVRQEGLTVGLPVETVERVFTLGFALEQLHQHLVDLDRCIREAAHQR
ncbi:MAG TPA: FUSC family protein [Xanthobacteraceae bacterium]|nr:FUSC family protein [Xanthobacteraceae bacterium]